MSRDGTGRSWVTLAVLLWGCSEDAPQDSAEAPASDAVVFYGDLEVTLDSYCLRCHQAGGGAPFDLSEYETAKAWALAMVGAIDGGRMPPPASDPDCHDYVDSELLVIPEAEKQRIRDWVANDMPAGDPADDLPISNNRYTLPEANLTVRIAAPYTPTYSDPDSLGNEYRCFTIDHGQDERFYITALHALIDKHEISHHMVMGKVPKDSTDAARGREPGGFDCSDEAAVATDGGFIHAWAPGQSPLRFNEGVGLSVSPGESFILQMHYYKGSESSAGLTDQPGYAFVTADTVATPAIVQTYGPTNFTIPAGDPEFTLTATQPAPQSGKIHAVFPHMHVLGTGYDIAVGDSCVSSGDYDFDNQMFYYFKEPILVEAGEEMSISCTWNNSTSNPDLILNPPQDIRFGERTDQEMCYAFMMVSL
jgi:hypothetical protein